MTHGTTSGFFTKKFATLDQIQLNRNLKMLNKKKSP